MTQRSRCGPYAGRGNAEQFLPVLAQRLRCRHVGIDLALRNGESPCLTQLEAGGGSMQALAFRAKTAELEQIRELGRRMDELLKRTQRNNRKIVDRFQRLLDRCGEKAAQTPTADEQSSHVMITCA